MMYIKIKNVEDLRCFILVRYSIDKVFIKKICEIINNIAVNAPKVN